MLVSAMHITAGVFVNDDESGLHADIWEWLEKLAPVPGDDSPDHHQTGEDNGDAHLKSLLVHYEVIVPDRRQDGLTSVRGSGSSTRSSTDSARSASS